MVASKIVPLVCTWNDVPPGLWERPKRPYLRKILNATARECRCMMEWGPPFVFPREKGSVIWRTLMRCVGAFDGSNRDSSIQLRNFCLEKLSAYVLSIACLL